MYLLPIFKKMDLILNAVSDGDKSRFVSYSRFLCTEEFSVFIDWQKGCKSWSILGDGSSR